MQRELAGKVPEQSYTERELQRPAKGFPIAFKRVLISEHSEETTQSQVKNHQKGSEVIVPINHIELRIVLILTSQIGKPQMSWGTG